MWVKLRSRSPKATRRGLRRDRRGSVQVVETMIVGLLVVSAVVAVSTLNVPTSTTESFKRENEQLVKDSLQAMLSRPSDARNGTLFGSVLEEYVMEAIAGYEAPLRNYLNRTLPGGAQYNVYLDNGHGPPYPVLESGTPPREAVAGSIQFVPDLAYTFIVPEFALYHGDFHQGVYSLPMQSGVLIHDEGETIELAVTFRDAPAGLPKGKPAVLKTYAHTALRMNDPAERSWPSVEIFVPFDHDGSALTPGKPTYYVDQSGAVLYGDKVNGLLSTGNPMGGNAYNFTWTFEINETTGIKVPKNAQITMEFPRGWDFNATQQYMLANHAYYGNSKYWKDWTFEGEVLAGWTVTAKLKDAFAGTRVPINMTSNYRMIFDSAYPYFNPVHVAMGGGVQGQSTIIFEPPSPNVVGVMTRASYLSTTKPLISGDLSGWGLAFTNAGASGVNVEIMNISLRQPQAKPVIDDIKHTNGWLQDGVWKKAGPGHFYWNRTAGYPVIANGGLAWLAFQVTGGYTQDNHYRNMDYQAVKNYYSPKNTTSTNHLGNWEFAKRAWSMNEEWVYKGSVPPSDGDPTGYTPGWPDETGYTYWFGAGTYGYGFELLGNTSYRVLPTGTSSNTFGDYQGTNVFSDLTVSDKKNLLTREVPLQGTATIKTNFTQVIGALSTIDTVQGVTVSDLVIRASVYTPEKAWKGIPTKVFNESVSLSPLQVDPLARAHATDVNGDLVQDIILVGTEKIWALDGRDGSKFWTDDLPGPPVTSALVDANDDGRHELVISTGAWVRGYELAAGHLGSRELWSHKAQATLLLNQLTYNITQIVDVSSGAVGSPDLALAGNAALAESAILGLDVVQGSTWSAVETGRYSTTETDRDSNIAIMDLKAATTSHGATVAFISHNRTATLLSVPALTPVWVSGFDQQPLELHVADLDRDGDQDFIINTYEPVPLGGDGELVYTLTGDTGHWGTQQRKITTVSENIVSREGGAAIGGGLFMVGGNRAILQDTTGMYSPTLAGIGADINVDMTNLELVVQTPWQGLHIAQDTVFLIDQAGRIMKSAGMASVPNNDYGYVWHELFGAGALSTLIDVHAPKEFPDSGTMHRMSKNQLQRWDGALWVADAGTCVSAGTPRNTEITCSSTETLRWVVREDANGNAESFIALIRIGDSTTFIYEYTLATQSWSQLGFWTNHKPREIHLAPDGALWFGGDDGYNGTSVLYRLPQGGTWEKHQLLGATGAVTGIVVQADGAAWAVTEWGQAWHRATPTGGWAAYHAAGDDTRTTYRLVEDLEGIVWVMGNDYAHTPLNARVHEGWAYLGTFFDGESLHGLPISKLRIQSTEGHLGGKFSDHRQLTDVQYEYRLPGSNVWIPLTHSDSGDDAGILERTHDQSIACGQPGACPGLELRAYLKQRTLTDGVETLRQDAGAGPMLRKLTVSLVDDLNGVLKDQTMTPTLATIGAGSSVTYSDQARGLVLPTDRVAWAYRGVENDGNQETGAVRLIQVTTTDPVDKSVGQDVVVSEEQAAGTRWFVLDGAHGYVRAPSGATTEFAGALSNIDGVIVRDMDNDGIEDVVLVGDGGPSSKGHVLLWRPSDGTVTEVDRLAKDVTGVLDTGVVAGRGTVAVLTGDAAVHAFHGALAPGSAPVLEWESMPQTAQGLATFEYLVPANAMYGTAIVVAELTWKIDEGLGVQSQTARMVDWFHITPPGRPVPVPPLYTVEIVSWFNEA